MRDRDSAGTPAADDRESADHVGLRSVTIRGFRSIERLELLPGPICALVGEASAGKSNVLEAIWRLLEPSAPPPGVPDAFRGGDGSITIGGVLAHGTRSFEATPPGLPSTRGAEPPPVLFLPAVERSDMLVAPCAPDSDAAVAVSELLCMSLGGQETPRSATTPALAFVEGLERCYGAGVTGLVLLIEEPELFLRPPAQRFLYRQLRAFAAAGNQVLYSTHSSAFLNVARLDEIVLVEHREDGTKVFRPEPLAADDSFRAMSEFDAERSELFLSRAALLVEGRTEKSAFPFLFRALGYDVDREGISIVECGGKSNIPLIARVCSATGVPFLVVHDRDAPHSREPISSERAVNAAIRTAAGAESTVILTPDFESVVGLAGRRRKPERAFRNLLGVRRAEVPAPLLQAVERVVALARR